MFAFLEKRVTTPYVRYLQDKKIWLPLKLLLLRGSHYCADRAQSLPGPAPTMWLTMFQISSISVHFRWSYNRMREGRSFGP